MKRVKRVLFVLPTDSIGGAERVAKNVILHLLDDDFLVELIVLSRGNNGSWGDLSAIPGFKVIYLNANSEKRCFIKLIACLFKDRKEYDMLYTTHTHVNALFSMLIKFRFLSVRQHVARESTVIYDRFFGFKKIIMDTLYFLYRDIDVLVFQTEYMRKRLLEEVPRLERLNHKVIRNPINFKYIDDKLNESKINCSKKYEIIFVGRLVKIKNLALVLNCLKELSLLTEELNLTVVGSGEDESELRELTQSLQIEQYVTFVGNVDNPYKFMKTSDLGVVSSIKEGFPNVIIEMMASGTKKIITTPCAGDLDTLPQVNVLKGFSKEEMTEAIINEWKTRSDNSSCYRKYAQSINVDKFIHQLLKATT